MSQLVLAKRRTLRRRRQAGAAMFVVSMMITVLGAVGVFALAAAATEVKTSGNERQNAQTHYLAEYATVAMARNLEQGRVQFFRQVATPPGIPDVCSSLPVPAASNLFAKPDPNALACKRVELQEFVKQGWATAPTVVYSGATPYSINAAAPGSLGPVPSTAGFYVELTDFYPVPAPGMSDKDIHNTNVTVTAYGQTQPLFAGNVSYGSEGVEMQRARVIAGPDMK